MPTIPTGDMEKELRKLYLRWLSGLSPDTDNLAGKINTFQAQSEALIKKMGGRVAALGALGDFPAPKLLELSPYAGKIYDGMQQAAVQAGIAAGMNSVDVARAMFRNGMDKSFNQLKRLARTETTNAYWKNAFDSVADLPALVMVWGSEDGPKTCEWCRERDGLVMDSPSLRDHPNGRCTPIPTLRSRVQYRGSIDANGRIYYDSTWDKKPKPAWDDFDFDNVRSQVTKDSDAWFDALSDAEKLSIKEYTSFHYQYVNQYVRTGAFDVNEARLMGVTEADVARIVESLDRALLSRPTPVPLVAYRGQQSWDRVADWESGMEVVMDSYTSSSMKRSKAEEFARRGPIFEIRIPVGSNAQYLGSGSFGDIEEEELLFGRGARFRVVERTDTGFVLELI